MDHTLGEGFSHLRKKKMRPSPKLQVSNSYVFQAAFQKSNSPTQKPAFIHL